VLHGSTAFAGQRVIDLTELKGSFEELLQRIASAPPSVCPGADSSDSDFPDHRDVRDLEHAILKSAAEAAAAAMNRDAVPSDGSADRLRTSVDRLFGSFREISARINAKWPEEARFRAETNVIAPVIVLKLGVRDQEALFTVGYRELSNAREKWRAWHAEESPYPDDPPWSQHVDVFPIHRGPSNRARFLVRLFPSGCAGSYGIKYRLFEWAPEEIGVPLSTLLSVDGSVSWTDRPRDFPEAGELRTTGFLVTLPYCWFSAIDTWDNPSLCAADTFDVSHDDVRFRSRVVNRPELYTIAQAIKYAEAHEYRAVRAYCRTAGIARAIMTPADPEIYADPLNVTRLSSSKVRIELGFWTVYHFEVEREPAGWVIGRFRVTHDH
jgi:hypothetical protein